MATEEAAFNGHGLRLMHGDCMEMMKQIPDKSVDLVLTDPPYNIKKADWDKIDGYIDWCAAWLKECARVLKENGSPYIWHNDMPQIAQLMERIRRDGLFAYISFCIWDKTEIYRARSWANRDPESNGTLRSWFNRCEYCLEFAKTGGVNTAWNRTGLDQINSNPECYKPLKEWIAQEKERLRVDDDEIAKAYTEATGKKPYMLRHYFQNSQFAIPTKAVWDAVYRPLGFGKEYEELRGEYEELRYYHRCDKGHCNVWTRAVLNTAQKESGHPCEKPVDLLQRIIRVSCRPGGVVLDLFMGGGSTGVAAIREDRGFIGIERDTGWFEKAAKRIDKELHGPKQMDMMSMLEGMQNGNA